LTPAAPSKKRARIAVLVDLARTAGSGGHVKWWERISAAAADEALFPFDLTVYFSGRAPDEILAPHVRLRSLPPIFSTARLKFLPYTPDDTDLSPYHPRLARELADYDLIHTTDGFFAFARTAERVARARRIPLSTSFHTDTPSYAQIFARETIESVFRGWPRLARTLIDDWRLPSRQGDKMARRLETHVRAASFAFATRPEDERLAQNLIGPSRVGRLRIGVDRTLFDPSRRDRDALRRDFNIPSDRVIALFVGRVDVGKNVPTLMEAAARVIAAGAPLHLIVAGVGPMAQTLEQRLGVRVSLPGFVNPDALGRLFAGVDLVALPSEVEIGGMAALEAIASGCPTLVARRSGTSALFGETAALRIVDGGPRAWAEAIAEVVGDAALREDMRQAAAAYGAHRLASWADVLNEDLSPGWRTALAGAGE
jgi:glycosyltransferase involved in cell wall biosynthesis